MKLRTLSLLATVAVVALGSAHATSISLSSTPVGRTVVDAEGLAVDDGSLVLVGTFSNISGLENLPALDLATAAGWTQFGASLAIGSIFGNPGKLLGTTTDTGTSANAFNNQPIYLWIFNGTTIANSTQYGIFTAPAGTPAWTFPVNNGGIADLKTLSADDSSLTALSGLGLVDASHIQLVSTVPEPATLGAFALGAAFFCLSRANRRRS